VCNLHFHHFLSLHKELDAGGIQEIIIFNSTRDRILADLPESPFWVIADPDKKLYREFGVGTSTFSVLNPAVWVPALKGAFRFGVQLPHDNESVFGLPAEFLINSAGTVVAAHYGTHANDQWTVDELLLKVRQKVPAL
jgi:hypothetical protein